MTDTGTGLRQALRSGFGFGLTSGVITTLGLMIGLYAGTNSRVAVIGGIVTIAIADALSDALGVHVAEEAERIHTSGEIWASTAATFLSKFLMSATFLVPLLLLPMSTAVVAASVWGLLVVVVLSALIARSNGTSVVGAVLEHVLIGVVVVVASHVVGRWVARAFA